MRVCLALLAAAMLASLVELRFQVFNLTNTLYAGTREFVCRIEGAPS